MNKPLSVESFQRGQMSKRFLTRIILRRIATNRWPKATPEHVELAKKILADELQVNDFANDLFLEAATKSTIVEVPEGATESEFLETIMKIFEWIKENPEFILLIIKLFGVA